MKRSRFNSIWNKMYAICAVLLVVVGISLFAVASIRFDIVYRAQAVSHMQDVGALAEENLEEIIDHIDEMSVSVVVDQVVQSNLKYINSNPEEADAENPFYKNVDEIKDQVKSNVFYTEGVISMRIYSRDGVEMIVGTTGREAVTSSLTTEEIYAANGGAIWVMSDDNRYISLYRAILSTSTFLPQGYMMIVLESSYFSDRLDTFPSVYGSEVYLLDQGGVIAASSDADAVGSRMDDYKDVSANYYHEGSALTNGWSLVMAMSKSKVREEILLYFAIVGGFLIVLLVLMLLLNRWAIRGLAGPTRRLVRSMNAFGDGDLSARVAIQSRDEIAEIGTVYNEMAENIEKLLKEVYSLEIANKEAEIEYLKMQITPHFLYNTLDTISWLGFTNGCEEITNLAVALADLLRSSIKNDDIITVKQELKTVRDYLYIQNHRFEDRFETEYDVDEEAYDCYMPNFILQPLIENSIIHGLESQLKKGVLRIAIHLDGEWLKFAVSDNGKGMSREQVEALKAQCLDMKSRHSIGLKNVYRRLDLLYHGSCEFNLSSSPTTGTCISFRIPSDVMPE